jgi:hypothetical protein
MKKAIILLAVSMCLTTARWALADCVGNGCYGSPVEVCDDLCSRIVEGDCSNATVNQPCSASGTNICLPISSPCATPDGGSRPVQSDAGAAILYCMTPANCENAGLWPLGARPPATGRRVGGLAAVFTACGILFLAIDRRRRRRQSLAGGLARNLGKL